ncbi:DUF6492 family protein [Alteromonas lipolytica]|uniref:Glycosyl transferase n=1 Tax=Alteromonas lipolytica TaxID=1856405 RepID=A0A1E8FAX5_9ALTE|nr:DUF6492 family protein [Alteromonas lipolytica]OFI33059.1 hypothetical protein BFC17_01965 [Alteromonas lipolytica]GGF62879.1 hypothetical protein GCM10011338_14140 [Alteromonas lipolytica]
MSKRNILVTPTFKDDLQRCERLVATAQCYLSGYEKHYLIIDEKEWSLFAHLASAKVVLMTKESLLPYRNINLPVLRKWWWGKKTLPVRGWIFQQLCKFAIAEKVDCDAIVFADSDVEFIRPFNLNQLWRGDKLRLSVKLRGPVLQTDRRYLNWYSLAARLFGITSQKNIKHGYIAQLNAFRRDTCLALLDHIAVTAWKPWHRALARELDLSEFILYGAFVEHVQQGNGHWQDFKQLTHSSWFYDIHSADDVQAYLNHLDKEHVAVHVQSNLGFSPEQYQRWIANISHRAPEAV